MKAEEVFKLNSGPAPKEWRDIPCIKEAYPKLRGHEFSLQRFDGTNLCAWYKRSSVYWNPASEIFLVEQEKEATDTSD